MADSLLACVWSSVVIACRFVDAGSQEAYWRLVVDSVLLKTNLSGCQVINVSHSSHPLFGLTPGESELPSRLH